MLKIAIIEEERFAKDFIFELQRVLREEFSFAYFSKISEFIKTGKTKEYDIIVLNESFNNIRVTDALEYQKSNSVIIYCAEEQINRSLAPYARIFSIEKKEYKRDLKKIEKLLEERMSKHKEYLLSYNGVTIKLKYHDIYYIEKEDKNLVYHTKKGCFYERGSIARKSDELIDYDFIRINSGILVNYDYIFKVSSDDIELIDHTVLPISRSRKSMVAKYIREKAQ